MSTTGSNLREISIVTKKPVGNLSIHDHIYFNYHPIQQENTYRPSVIKEILEVTHGQMSVDGFSNEELEEILHYICTS